MTNLKSVAKLAGVSASTVSRVLSGKSAIKEDTRQRVMNAIQQTGYHPNALAKSLKMGRSDTIALMVPSVQNLIFAQITRGVEDTARRNGFMVVLCNTDEDPEAERAYIEKLRHRLIDGFIVASLRPGSDQFRELRSQGVPLVLVNRYIPGDPMDVVTVDNYSAAKNAVHYLIRCGRKRIAVALGHEEHIFYRERFRGYRDALAEANLPYEERLIMRETNGTESFYQLTKQLIASDAKPDAVFATSDPKAIMVMHALHDLKVRIPEDVAVLGFDNVELSAVIEPPLTTVSQPLYGMGVAAAKKLIHQIRYKEEHDQLPPPSMDVLITDLIVRRST